MAHMMREIYFGPGIHETHDLERFQTFRSSNELDSIPRV